MKTRWELGLWRLLALWALGTWCVAAQAAGGYRIAGKVVNAVTGDPVPRASVAVLSEEDSHTIESVECDGEGQFALDGLPAAKYQLTASKRGYRTGYFNEHEEFSTAIVTGEGQDTGALVFRLMPAAVLHGVVNGDGGEPVEGAYVMLFEKPNGHRPHERIAEADAATTDDTGGYEFDNLAPGEYLVAVRAEPWYAVHRAASKMRGLNDPSTALDVAFPVTYYDSTTDEGSATAIVLAGGSREEANINLHAAPALHLLVPIPAGENRPELRQSVLGIALPTGSVGLIAGSPPAGMAEYDGVAPGRYEMTLTDPARVVTVDASTSQQVDPNQGTPMVKVSGVVRTAAGVPLPYDVTVTLDWLSGAHPQEQIRTVTRNGAFGFTAAAPSDWSLQAAATSSVADKTLSVLQVGAGSRVKAGNLVQVGERTPALVVTVSEGATKVKGFAKKGGKGLAGAMVVLAPRDLTAMDGLSRRDQSDSDGSFSLQDVAPGQYTLVAIENGWDLDWGSPDVIRRYLPGGTAVTVTDGSGKEVHLSDPVAVQER